MLFTFHNRISPAQILHEADGKGGGGGSNTVEAKLPDDVVEGFRNLISKEGGDKDAAATLFLENKSLRDDRRKLQDKLDAYQEIAEDPEDLKKKFNAFQEIEEDPEKLKEKLEKGEEAIEKTSQYEREKSNREVAQVQGWNPKVLNRLSGEDAEYEIKTRKNDKGEDEKYAVLKTEDGEKDLSKHAESEWGDMMPALKATGDNGEQEKSSSGKSFTKQKSSSDSKKSEGGYLKNAIKKNHKAAGITSDEDE